MHWMILVPFAVQAIVIMADEYYFHVKRGLPLWERIGHPVDTLSLIICLLFVLLVPYSAFALKWYIGLSVFSCLCVTKDEWVHKHVCPASEQWLHALLFINHPIVLASIGILWRGMTDPSAPKWIQTWLGAHPALQSMLIVQTGATILFFLYQVIYWNFIWKEKEIKEQ